jgi:hypothetical protein
VNALADAMNQDKNVFLATQKKAGVDNPTEKDIILLEQSATFFTASASG